MNSDDINEHTNGNQNKESQAPRGKDAPVDPSNTSHIGEHVDQGVISKKEGITEQSSDWEKLPDEGHTGDSIIDNKADHYIKSPSPEEKGTEL